MSDRKPGREEKQGQWKKPGDETARDPNREQKQPHTAQAAAHRSATRPETARKDRGSHVTKKKIQASEDAPDLSMARSRPAPAFPRLRIQDARASRIDFDVSGTA